MTDPENIARLAEATQRNTEDIIRLRDKSHEHTHRLAELGEQIRNGRELSARFNGFLESVQEKVEDLGHRLDRQLTANRALAAAATLIAVIGSVYALLRYVN